MNRPSDSAARDVALALGADEIAPLVAEVERAGGAALGAYRDPKSTGADNAAKFESPELLTLGIAFASENRFAAGAYAPFLRKVVARLEERGFRSPYLRTYVVARCNPVRFHKPKKGEAKAPMPVNEALTRMLGAAKKFDVAAVRQQDLALVAAVASE